VSIQRSAFRVIAGAFDGTLRERRLKMVSSGVAGVCGEKVRDVKCLGMAGLDGVV
jgi:hypothetical protein